MAYKPIHVANAFLFKGREDSIAIDQLKIQKLVYCLHGWHLAVRGEPAVGEFYEAWKYGPVLSSVYGKFKRYKSNSITDYAATIDPETGQQSTLMVSLNNADFEDIFNRVWARYRYMSGLELSALTHAEGTPWWKARQEKREYLDNIEIMEHYRALAVKAS